jgi:hypothetical protein
MAMANTTVVAIKQVSGWKVAEEAHFAISLRGSQFESLNSLASRV